MKHLVIALDRSTEKKNSLFVINPLYKSCNPQLLSRMSQAVINLLKCMNTRERRALRLVKAINCRIIPHVTGFQWLLRSKRRFIFIIPWWKGWPIISHALELTAWTRARPAGERGSEEQEVRKVFVYTYTLTIQPATTNCHSSQIT